ncbi:alginate export family protein [Natronospira bacteriovora]|uniref:Beta-barrel porin 2 n=1 Tax=Natronospira bacteriovora TaxID=3069753 RepID=A0ABU0W332_9GAMM|nr:alginate export family protein [Natronospira sp. AB-CW4]MDQ2068424.1 hypothetical protein [Natronospira sp. AB-CW4]
MPIRLSLMFLALTLVVTGCASPVRCDEDREEPYMDPLTGEPLDMEGLAPRESRSERFRIPSEERADRSRANPCLAQAPRIIPPPTPVDREMEEGTAFADLRYRLEIVEDDDFRERAEASTIRLRLGGTTPRVRGFDAGVAFQTTQLIGEPRFEDTTGRIGDFPVVRDPLDTGVSEGWARYISREGVFEAKIGRQSINLDNERFVGSDSFRQLEQTFNASTMRIGQGEPVRFDAAFISRANRVLGPNHPDRFAAKADTEATILEYNQVFGDRTMGLYFHNMRFTDERESHRNLGLRFHGRLPWSETLDFRAEYAHQEALRGEGPERDQSYTHFRLSQNREDWRWFVGREHLSGDRQDAFQTPLASLHTHNGWSDRFLVTPDFGLIDNYIGVETQRGEWDFEARYHDFKLDAGSSRYGQEFGLRAGREVFGELRLDLKLSHYDGGDPEFYFGDDYAGNSTRIWIGLSARFEP